MAWWERHGPSELPSCDVKVGRQNWHHGLASDLSTHAMTPLNPCTTLIKESKPKIRMVSSPVKLLFLMQKILYHIKRFSKNSKHWRSRRTLSLGFPCKHNFSDGTWFKKKCTHRPPTMADSPTQTTNNIGDVLNALPWVLPAGLGTAPQAGTLETASKSSSWPQTPLNQNCLQWE